MQKYSKLFPKSKKTAKRDMSAKSHKLLYRGGFIRELSSGRYQFLPLGFKVWENIVEVINDEMKKIGSQRFSIPILQPMEYWKKSNRDEAWGDLLMKVEDAREREFALSATGEGVVTEMVAKEKPSYKDLPIILHQFIIKLRDEMRARGGLLRTREFVMKDAYSFHTSEDDFMKTYKNFYKAYENICNRFELTYEVVLADSGALGGDYCHEFQIPAEVGEDHIVTCTNCDYAANVERAEFDRKEVNKDEEVKEFDQIQLPEDVKTIDDLVKHYDMPKERFIKNVAYKTKSGQLIVAIVTGDLDVNAVKLAAALDISEDDLEYATEEDLESIGTKHGYVHSWGYEDQDNITVVVDEVITKAKNLYGGYKTETTDPINVNYGRDFEGDIVADIAEASEGSKCANCNKGNLNLTQTIEFGHIFKYDHFYTKHHDGYFVNKEGNKELMYMGAYGIGIGRAMATIVEKHNDNNGILWPKEVAPYQIHIITIGDYGEKAKQMGEMLEDEGYEVLWDDRNDVSVGEKFADADLIGNPVRLVISNKSQKAGGVEVKERDKDDEEIVPKEELTNYINKIFNNTK